MIDLCTETSTAKLDQYFWDGPCESLYDHGFDRWPLPFVDNSTIKLPGGREVYVVVNNTKCLVNDMQTFQKLGLDFDDTVTINQYEFANIRTCAGGKISL
jgi:hypothetical protein